MYFLVGTYVMQHIKYVLKVSMFFISSKKKNKYKFNFNEQLIKIKEELIILHFKPVTKNGFDYSTIIILRKQDLCMYVV